LRIDLDDAAFSAMGPYGRLIQTPNIKRIDAPMCCQGFHGLAWLKAFIW